MKKEIKFSNPIHSILFGGGVMKLKLTQNIQLLETWCPITTETLNIKNEAKNTVGYWKATDSKYFNKYIYTQFKTL